MKTYLTGIKPTGMPHIGNVAGAILPAIQASQNNSKDRFLYFIADYHSLTSTRDPSELKKYVHEVAATWLAFGLDPEKVIFYKQSDVPEIFELNWILSCLTPKGDLNRAHSYKDCVQKNIQKDEDPDHGVNMGLFNYPVLMSADILLFGTNYVPVGKDQIQHIEIARSIAQRFNVLYKKNIFVEPQELIQPDTAVIVGLDGRKMSKSYDNTIPALISEKKLQKLIYRITTDSLPPEAPKDPNTSHIFEIYKTFASAEKTQLLEARFKEGIAWGHAKEELFFLLNDILKEPRKIYDELIQDEKKLDSLLHLGALKAREIAAPFLNQIKESIGI